MENLAVTAAIHYFPWAVTEDIPAQEDRNEPFDQKLAHEALALIRKQVTGNGMKPDNIRLKSVEGKTYVFGGHTTVKLSHTTQEGRRPGRLADGQLVKPEHITQAVQEFTSRSATDYGVRHAVQTVLSERPDHGFGLHGQTIPLKGLNRNFIVHDPCMTCKGAGHKMCANCQGQMRVGCYRCHGQGGVPCITCHGSGRLQTPSAMLTCQACHGRGLSPCPVCRGERFVNCPDCHAQGRKACESCNGQGWWTRNWLVTLSAQTAAVVKSRFLPTAGKDFLDKNNMAKLIEQGHLRVEQRERPDPADAPSPQQVSPDDIILFYDAKLPYAELAIQLGRPVVNARLAGFRARLVDVPHFMDALLKKPASLLHSAAHGGTDAAGKIVSAARYRAVGDVLRAVIKSTRKQAAATLVNEYRIGLSDAFARALVINAAQAVSKLSLWPRINALAITLAAAFLTAFYLTMMGGRMQLIRLLQLEGIPPYSVYGLDIALAAVIAGIGHYCVRYGAGQALAQVLEGLNLKRGNRGVLPRAGIFGTWLWASVFGIFGGFIALSLFAAMQ